MKYLSMYHTVYFFFFFNFFHWSKISMQLYIPVNFAREQNFPFPSDKYSNVIINPPLLTIFTIHTSASLRKVMSKNMVFEHTY